MRKSILTYGLLLVTSCTITIMFAVENLWGNSLSIYFKETKNGNTVSNHLKDEITTYTTCIWLGTTSSDWSIPSNWSTGVVPGPAVDVTIPSGGISPVINSEAACHHITIETGAVLSILNSNTLKVYGNWINNGTFIPELSTVSFEGTDQTIGSGPYKNLTIGGSGIKTVGAVQVTGILSMEGTANLSNTISYTSTTILQYNSTEARTIGKEWPATQLIIAGIIIKNSGKISLTSSRTLDITLLTVFEGATLDLNTYDLTVSPNLNLQCGGYMTGSLIKGSGLLTLKGDMIVSNCGKGKGAATIECPIHIANCTFDVSDGNPNSSDPTDLWINTLDAYGSLKKTGLGTISIRGVANFPSNLTIDKGNFTIQPSGSASIKGHLYNNVGVSGLYLLSDMSGTGSLFVSFPDINTNNATVVRYMAPRAWHLVSAPVIGQTIGNFLSTNSAIPSPVGATEPRAMRAYDPPNNQWGEFFSSTNTNTMTTGKGYCMRVKASAIDHNVVFSGTLQIGNQTITNLSSGNWNCIGNPYTSAININVSALNGENFLSVNAATSNPNIDPAYGVYIWDAPDAANGQTGKYTAISNVPTVGTSCAVQQGQAFMVKMANGKTSVSFTKAMQVHDVSLSLKSTDNTWPAIKLITLGDSVSSSTLIAFHEGMTNGLDITYDAGLLKSGGSMELYTRLIDDYGIPFAIQALPSDQYDRLIIPVGVDYTKGGKVSFSADGMYLPSSCRPILEDRLTGILIDLSDQTYTADLTANTAGTGRFYLHTSYATTSIRNDSNRYNLNVKFMNRNQLKIQGSPIKNATASLTDALGRQIILRKIEEQNINIINIPTIKPGLYLLSVKNSELMQTYKLAYTF